MISVIKHADYDIIAGLRLGGFAVARTTVALTASVSVSGPVTAGTLVFSLSVRGSIVTVAVRVTSVVVVSSGRKQIKISTAVIVSAVRLSTNQPRTF